jgi:hypothetical protein
LLQNGVQWAPSYTPFSCTSAWNLPIKSSNPPLASYSGTVVANQFPNDSNSMGVRNEEAGGWDFGHPVYFASASDPVVNVRCTGNGGACDNADNGGFPAQMHIPTAALRACPGYNGFGGASGYCDHHLAVVQPDAAGNVGAGPEIDFWGAQNDGSGSSGNWQNGDTIAGASVANCGTWSTSTGWYTQMAGPITAAGSCLGGGLLRADELAAGQINHALQLITPCQGNFNGLVSQFPAAPGSTGGHFCTSNVGPILGAHLWLDYPDSYINGLNIQPWEKAILRALHDYGGYYVDNSNNVQTYGTGLALQAESGEAYSQFGSTDPFATLASEGWYSISVSGSTKPRWIGKDQWNPAGIDWQGHLHYLAASCAQAPGC